MPKDGIEAVGEEPGAPTPFRNARRPRSAAIVQRIVTDYNVPFFNGLQESLAGQNINLRVFAGDDGSSRSLKNGIADVPCAVRVPNFRIAGKMYWQPILSTLLRFDLVVVEQANAALLNYPLLLLGQCSRHGARVAFWGHGKTMSPDETGPLRSGLKRSVTGFADHFFAYTDLSRKYLIEIGFPADRITVVNNSLDTSLNRSIRCTMDDDARQRTRAAYGIDGGPLAVFCARLLKCRNFPFLLEACRLARARFPGLQLVLVGDGEERRWLQHAAAGLPWVKLCGALYGRQKAELLASGDVFVMPAYVGLSILDAFSAGLPVVSTRSPGHGPEIAYLTDGRNGFLTPAEPSAFADAICSVLGEQGRRATMSRHAAETAEFYGLEHMIRRFAGGIGRALA